MLACYHSLLLLLLLLLLGTTHYTYHWYHYHCLACLPRKPGRPAYTCCLVCLPVVTSSLASRSQRLRANPRANRRKSAPQRAVLFACKAHTLTAGCMRSNTQWLHIASLLHVFEGMTCLSHSPYEITSAQMCTLVLHPHSCANEDTADVRAAGAPRGAATCFLGPQSPLPSLPRLPGYFTSRFLRHPFILSTFSAQLHPFNRSTAPPFHSKHSSEPFYSQHSSTLSFSAQLHPFNLSCLDVERKLPACPLFHNSLPSQSEPQTFAPDIPLHTNALKTPALPFDFDSRPFQDMFQSFTVSCTLSCPFILSCCNAYLATLTFQVCPPLVFSTPLT